MTSLKKPCNEKRTSLSCLTVSDDEKRFVTLKANVIKRMGKGFVAANQTNKTFYSCNLQFTMGKNL
jgi:hypothetical protein